jgi:hypothetical protein
MCTAPAENNTSCPSDCPKPATGCKNMCGLTSKTSGGGNCYCDTGCVAAKVCCSDYQQFCGGGTCVPNCSGKACGDNGCGGTCGTCPSTSTCSATGQCVSKCGNGVCDSGESNSTCPKDCPASTVGCKGKCGTSSKTSSGTTYYCDSVCTSKGDCCPDKKTYCP